MTTHHVFVRNILLCKPQRLAGLVPGILFFAAILLVGTTGAAQTIYWSTIDNVGVERGDIDDLLSDPNTRETVIEDPNNTLVYLSMALDPIGGKIYMTNQNEDSIERANLDGTGLETIFDAALDLDPNFVGPFGRPFGIAIDGVNGDVYFTDRGEDDIYKVKADGSSSNVSPLFENVTSQPNHVDLDIPNGHLYFTDQTDGGIYRVNTNGTGGLTTLVSPADSDQTRGIALDLTNRHIYWTEKDGSRSIVRSDLNGNNVTELLTAVADRPGGIELDLTNSLMYWSDDIEGGGVLADLQRAALSGDPNSVTPVLITGVQTTDLALLFPVTCDFDGGGCGLSDINLMMAQGDLVAGVVASPSNQFDLDSDNDIDGDDITEWLSLTGTANGFSSPMLRGDTDDLDNMSPMDRTVDITDFQNFLVGFTGAGSTWEVGNFNGDDVVDITDFSNHFLPNFSATGGGTYGAGQSIPEPSTVLLLGLGGALLAYAFGRESLAT